MQATKIKLTRSSASQSRHLPPGPQHTLATTPPRHRPAPRCRASPSPNAGRPVEQGSGRVHAGSPAGARCDPQADGGRANAARERGRKSISRCASASRRDVACRGRLRGSAGAACPRRPRQAASSRQWIRGGAGTGVRDEGPRHDPSDDAQRREQVRESRKVLKDAEAACRAAARELERREGEAATAERDTRTLRAKLEQAETRLTDARQAAADAAKTLARAEKALATARDAADR